MFYGNLIKYLTATGATEDNLAAISFRNYSSAKVDEMGNMVKEDGDVDLLIGVGNNVNSTAGLSLYNSSNDYKFQTKMSTNEKGEDVSRYVALLDSCTELGVTTYEWLKDTDAGRKSFLAELTDEEIEASLAPEEINLTVTVRGDTNEVTVLDDKDDVIKMPEITVAEGKMFKGFALTQDGEVALDVNKDAVLKYEDVKELVAEGEHTLDLYAVIKDIPVVEDDLVVYIQINGSYLTIPEATLLAARFTQAHPEEHIKFNIIDGDATTFDDAVGDDADVVIGGNNPLKNYTLYDADNYPLANAGGLHFASTNRKVIIKNTVNPGHVELAKALYNFVKDDAPVYKLLTAVWTKDGDWVTDDEAHNFETEFVTHLNTYLNITGEDTLKNLYNVEIEFEEVTTSGNKVADLAAATQALNDGKGADLIVGCGGNIDQQTGYEDVLKKGISDTAHTFVTATNRYVALVHDNCLADEIFNNYFVFPTE